MGRSSWPELPEVIRAGILAMVRAAVQSSGRGYEPDPLGAVGKHFGSFAHGS